jgi:hypothetical protein
MRNLTAILCMQPFGRWAYARGMTGVSVWRQIASLGLSL